MRPSWLERLALAFVVLLPLLLLSTVFGAARSLIGRIVLALSGVP